MQGIMGRFLNKIKIFLCLEYEFEFRELENLKFEIINFCLFVSVYYILLYIVLCNFFTY